MSITHDKLVHEITERMPGFTKKAVEKFLRAQRQAIHAAISDGETKIKIIGLGVFNVKTYKGRPARNPKTGEPVQVPPRTRVKYTMDAKIRAVLPPMAD